MGRSFWADQVSRAQGPPWTQRTFRVALTLSPVDKMRKGNHGEGLDGPVSVDAAGKGKVALLHEAVPASHLQPSSRSRNSNSVLSKGGGPRWT